MLSILTWEYSEVIFPPLISEYKLRISVNISKPLSLKPCGTLSEINMLIYIYIYYAKIWGLSHLLAFLLFDCLLY